MPDPATQPDADPLLVDAAEVCRLLSVGTTTLKTLIRTGRLPLKRHRLCRKMLFSRDEMKEWVTAGMPPASRWSFVREQKAMRATG
ncbi:MAG: helix-turn-helix domain-containing protein [Tepidisphaeraceae bacterium]